ncbi:MAG: DUF927 domain-containing protein [Bacteroidales bacterium]
MELEFNRCPAIDGELKAWAIMYPEIKEILAIDPATYEKGEQACFELKACTLAGIHDNIISDKGTVQIEYAFYTNNILKVLDEYAGGSWIHDAPDKLKDRREAHITKIVQESRAAEELERKYINNIVREWNKYDAPKAEKGEYDIRTSGIYRSAETINEATGDIQYIQKEVCRTPFILCGVSVPHFNDENVFYKVRYPSVYGEIKEFWASLGTLLSRKELKTLFLSKGMNCPENALLMETLEYISRSIGEFSQQYKKEFSAKRNGWTDDNSCFVLGDRSITSGGTFPILSVGDGKGFPELEKKGTVKGWAEGVSSLLDFDVIRFKCYDAMTAPLNSVLGVESHVTDHYGNTSQGKTFSAWVALSMVGDAEGLTIGAKSTAKGILVHVRDFSDLPILIDESSDAGEHLSDLVYPLTSNKGRVKSTVDGQRDGGEEYHTTTMFTGEKPIRDCLQNSGQQYRVNELDDTLPDLLTKDINRVKRAIRDNHGHIIEMYIQEVFKRMEKGTLQTLYDECFDKLPDNTSNIEGRSRSIFACIMVAGEILESIFKKIGIPTHDPSEIVNKYFEKCIIDKPVELEYIRALRVVLDWVHSDYGRFSEVDYTEAPIKSDDAGNLSRYDDKQAPTEHITMRDKNKRYGFVDPIFIDIFGSEFSKKMKEEGFSPMKIKEDWWKQGITASNDDKRPGTYRTSRKGHGPYAGVRINRAIATELAGYNEDVSLPKDDKETDQYTKIKLIMETIQLLTKVQGEADIQLIRQILNYAELDDLLSILSRNGKILTTSQTTFKSIY